MYQVTTAIAPIGAVDDGRLFLESCSATTATENNLSLIRSAATMMSAALESNNLKPLSDFVGTSLGLGYELADVLAAAGQLVIDGLGDVSISLLEKSMRRIATIQRDVLPLDDFAGFPAEGFVSRAFAG